MKNTHALATAIHAAYKADGGPVLIDVQNPRLTCVQGIKGYYAIVGGYDRHNEATGVTRTVYDAPGKPRIHS